MNKTGKKTTSIDRNGNLYIIGTAGFTGTLLELRNLIDNSIEEYGEKAKCRFDIYSNHGYHNSQITIEK
jgi:hypothetical protein